MLKLQMLPAACGDCLWIEYGAPPATRLVIIDGGLRETGAALCERLEALRRERAVDVLEVELLVVTHIDNDHILGVIELLKTAPASIRFKDVWFNGRPQLSRLPPPPPRGARRRGAAGGPPSDLMGSGSGTPEGPDDEDDWTTLPTAADLLGPQQGDELSTLMETRSLPWNSHPAWSGAAIRLPDDGVLPAVTLDGGLKLTLLGPTLKRLYKLCAAWPDVLAGRDEASPAGPSDLLGRRDTWPPVWKDGEKRDPSAANGSSIVLLAEYPAAERSQGTHALLLAGDGHAPDLVAALDRLRSERALDGPLPLAAFKLAHHGSDKNLTRALLGTVECRRYLISTDGSTHSHPDHQALLRILRYSKGTPELLFNHAAATTTPWREAKADVLDSDRVGVALRDYRTAFPERAEDGLVLALD